ncbi:MAG: dienelactone hydrolase family protein [Burkholderiales bacterium]|nr:dienelactone hydrolase family protein [Burkholderiales bacterium]
MKSILFIIVASYAGLCLLLYFKQGSLIFPAPQTAGKPQAPTGWVVETLQFKSHDQLALTAWLVRPSTGMAPLLIYFGGNAEEVSWTALNADRAGAHALLLVNYRGYGGHPGDVSEAGLVADALSVFDQAKALTNIRNDRISIHGRSLGSAVAVAVAAARPVDKVILTTPFDSLRAIAGNAYPYLPTSWLLQHPFDSVMRAPQVKAPVLVLVADRDQIMRPNQHEALAKAWGGPVQIKRFATADHNDIPETAGYWDTIAAFLKSSSPAP